MTDAELYRRGARTLIASWEEYARGARDAAVAHAPGVACAVFAAEPERAVYNNALLDRGRPADERAAALDAMEAIYANAGVARFAAWAHEDDAPLRQIAENAGLEGSVVVNDVRKAKKGQGLNAATGEIVDLVAAGVIDPAMVTRSALQNAASIGKNILTTEAIVAEVPDKDGGMPGMPGGMDGMM